MDRRRIGGAAISTAAFVAGALLDMMGLQLDTATGAIGLGLCALAFVIGLWLVMSSPSQRLSRRQKERLSDELKRIGWRPESTAIRFAIGCPDCETYSADFEEAFRWAGWSGQRHSTLDEVTGLRGLHIAIAAGTAKPNDAALLASALRYAGVPFSWSTMEGPLNPPVVLFIYPKA